MIEQRSANKKLDIKCSTSWLPSAFSTGTRPKTGQSQLPAPKTDRKRKYELKTSKKDEYVESWIWLLQIIHNMFHCFNCNSAYLQQKRSLKYDQPCLVVQKLLCVYWCRSTGFCLPSLHYLRHHYRCQ